MSTRKRKATEEPTRHFVEVREPNRSPDNMVLTPGVLSTAWNWLRNFCAPANNAEMASPPTTKSVEDVRVEILGLRDDGATSLKRQKTREKTTRRSRSAAGPRRDKVGNRGGIGTTGIEGCKDEAEMRQRLDAYWTPDILLLPSSRGTKSIAYPTPPPESNSEREQEETHPLQRRHSDTSSESPRTMLSSFASIWHPSASSGLRADANHPRQLRTPESQERDAVDNLQALFDDLDTGGPYLRTSEAKAVELRRQREERRRREKEELARIRRERRLRRQHPLHPLIRPLSPAWNQNVAQTLSMNYATEITTGIAGTPLRRKDFETLLGSRAWLNDEIINAYLEWVVAAANLAAVAEAEVNGDPQSTVPKFIAQNSFFYENLSSKGPNSTERLMKRKKAPGSSFMEVDSMFIPICRSSHWTVGVVRPISKTIEYFDSMGGRNPQFIALMRGWLKFQLGSLYKEDEWTVDHTKCAHQSNGWDCGVFVCTNTFCVALGLDPSCYHERDMVQQRKNIAAILINRGFIGDFAWGSAGLLP